MFMSLELRNDRKLRCLVVDDEPLARELLKGYIESTPVLTMAGSLSSAAEAMPLLKRGEVDLLFLDINMPLLNGIDFASLVPPEVRIVFVTAYDRFALDGFRLNALDYILKPVSYAEFMRAVGKAVEWFALTGNCDDESRKKDSSRYIILGSDNNLLRLRPESILYAEAQGNRVSLVKSDSEEPLILPMTLTELENHLPYDSFMRVHRSFIVRLGAVEILEKGRIRFGRVLIPVSDSRREEFLGRLSR